MNSPFRLDGRRALVTGGASGIGEQICRVFSAAGASVIVADVDSAGAAALARELPHSSPLIFDVTDEAAVEAALASLDGLDILVNNAGVGHVGNIEETEPADFRRLLRVNVEGMYLVTRAAMPKLLASRGCGEAAPRILRQQRRGGGALAATGHRLRRKAARKLHLPRHRGDALCGRLPGEIP
jgi:NAD(P)-dependent dehydrogenase (short-subunit alcohol dehydrogenase family)